MSRSPRRSGPVAGEIAGPPDDAPGAVEPAPPTAHRPLARRLNLEYAGVREPCCAGKLLGTSNP